MHLHRRPDASPIEQRDASSPATPATAEQTPARRDLYNAILPEIPSLRRYARFLTRDPDVADDLVQEALTRAVGAADSFRLGTNIRAWLFTILKNVVRNSVRRGRHNPIHAVETLDTVVRCDPADQPDARLELTSLAEAIDSLPPSFKQVLILCGVEGFLYEEAATVLDVPVGTVRSRLFRARNLLSKRIDVRSQTFLGHTPGTRPGAEPPKPRVARRRRRARATG